jgi:UDP-2,3-diacylglucosamine pyrophosphatase LpxH
MNGNDRITLIVSDLHVGGGTADPGDDHIYQNGELVRLLREQAASGEGQAGRLELVFNGDFLEFAQTNQGAFNHVSDDAWCSEPESLAKIDTILAGHADIFAELAKFQKSGNRVTIVAGNHDVDLYWPGVQSRLREAAGAGITFELGKEWIERYDGKLAIAHGHMKDAANRFEHWDNPVRAGDWGVERLEMCPGTLFMVKFVNKLEASYPFADNLQPVTKLAWILMRQDRAGFASMGWMMTAFVLSSPWSTLGKDATDDYGARLIDVLRNDADRKRDLDAALAANGLDEHRADLAADRLTREALAKAMLQLLGRIDDTKWHALFDLPPGATLGSDDVTLGALTRAGFDDGKETLRRVAQQRVDAGAKVVVMGHTHQPDTRQLDGGMYYNPGCWTRYLELKPGQKVTLDDLKDESRYPYQLNFVRVERDASGKLQSKMHCFAQG